jgi:hypothetical protein
LGTLVSFLNLDPILSYNASAVKSTTPKKRFKIKKAVNSKGVGLAPGSNPTIVSYKTRTVKIYNARRSLVHFICKQEIIFFNYEKRSSLLIFSIFGERIVVLLEIHIQ